METHPMQTITIPVEPDIQVAFEQASDEERQALGVLISLLLKEGWSKKSLLEVMQEIGNRAKNRGLTSELLPEIVEETQPEPKPRLMAQLRQMKILARPTGLCTGDFVVPEDFDQPLPDAILDEFERE